MFIFIDINQKYHVESIVIQMTSKPQFKSVDVNAF